jgi:hypothetical protein
MGAHVTDRQREVTARVIQEWQSGHRWYRAAGSGERVTLASLHRAGVLHRRVWRGVEGESNAAHEYRPSNDLLTELARASGVSQVAEAMPEHAASRSAITPNPGKERG